jgi:hypothetical protein
MQVRQALRLPIFVAKKSQYRNCQWQERVAFSHRCAGGGEAGISTLHHGRLNWLAAAASFLKRIYSNRMIPRLPAAETMPRRAGAR